MEKLAQIVNQGLPNEEETIPIEESERYMFLMEESMNSSRMLVGGWYIVLYVKRSWRNKE